MNASLQSLVQFILAGTFVLFTSTGCSTFNRDWMAADRQPNSAAGLVGAWDGTWKSEASRHHGRLQCLISESSPREYQARFRATFGKIFHSSYTVPLSVTQTNGQFEFRGQANLGSLAGGDYTYVGHASPTNFFSTYQSKYDHGVFELHRP